MELASHQEVTAATGLDVYLADPRSPWQRGTNENTNGLLRQYFSQGDVARRRHSGRAGRLKLNTRPRKVLGYATPAATLEKLLR